MQSPVKPLSSAHAARRGVLPAPHGFTAIELMVVIAMIAILAALAAPSFNSIMERWRVFKAVKGMESTLHLARSEAIKRNGLVAIQKLANSTDCSLAKTNQEWSCGWQIFVDSDNDGSLDNNEEVLQITPAPKNVNIIMGNGARFLRVDRWGQISNLGTAGIQFSPHPTGVSSPATTRLCVSSGGRIDARRQAVSCS